MREDESRFGEGEGGESRKTWSLEQNTGLRFAGRVVNSSNSDRAGVFDGCEAHSRKFVPAAMVEVTRSSTWQENVTLLWKE